MRFLNRVTIATGAGYGTWRATAEPLAEEVAKVVIVDIDAQGGNGTVSAISLPTALPGRQ